MFWSTPKLPLPEDQRAWVDESLQWLLKEFGTKYFLERKIILPHISFFPDSYKGTRECVERVLNRVCGYMNVDPATVSIALYNSDDRKPGHRDAPGESSFSGPVGLYLDHREKSGKMVIALNETQIGNATSLVATIAHELGHVILLGGGKISGDRKDHELLTDLVTVFLGLGIFTANAAFQFSQWQGNRMHGWSASRQGYMSEEMFAYSLAACAWMRGETSPEWARYLSLNVGAHFKSAWRYFARFGSNSLPKLQP